MEKKTNTVLVTIAIFVATFMTAIEGTIVSTAMPTIVSDLNGLEIMNWVVSIFLLMTAVATPIYGKLADSIGRKPVFIFGLTVFIIGSALCGLAQNMVQLILFRIIQGLGAGAIQPVSFTIIADIYPIEKRAKVLGLNGSAWGIASILAPLLGGFIVEQISWHWIFYINVPVGLLTIFLVSTFLREPKRKMQTRLDVKGTTLLVTLLVSLMLFLQELANKNILVPIALRLVVVVRTPTFIKVEEEVADPILPLTILKNRQFIGINLVALFISGFLIGFEFYLPMWMQGILGEPATAAGFAVTPSSILWILGSFVTGNLMSKISIRKLLFMSLSFLFVGNFLFIIVPNTTPFLFFFVISSICGFGFGTAITATTVASQTVVGPENVGVATSFNSLLRYLGQTMMVSIFGIVFNLKVASGMNANPAISSKIMNQVVNSKSAKKIAPNVLGPAQDVLFTSLKAVFISSIVVIVVAMIINFFNKSKNELELKQDSIA